jgi:predicted transcriptional regulator YdeE
VKLKEPQIRTEGELKFVGLSRNVPFQEMQTIAGQWQHFMSTFYGDIENKIDEPPVGITTAANDESIDYVCAAGVVEFAGTPKGCVKITLAPATYAVFAHDGHVTRNSRDIQCDLERVVSKERHGPGRRTRI